ncbi:transcriptional regulator, partial [Campylobacter jejuni]|nr:transcriptional regulator [Campylobacter jejuni]
MEQELDIFFNKIVEKVKKERKKRKIS